MTKRITERLPIFIALSIVYFLAAKMGLKLAIVHPSATAVWPPTGIALAAILIFGYDVWPAIFLGAFVANWTTAGSAATSIGIALGNTLEGLVGGFLISKFAHGRRAFACAEDVLKFAFLGGVVSTSIAATFGVVSLLEGGFLQGTDRVQVWTTWWLGDMMGAVVVGSFLILWSARPTAKRDRREVFQGATAAFGLLFMGSILFGGFLPSGVQHYPLVYLCIPFVIWAVFHLRAHEVTAAVVVLSGIAIWGTLHGFGPFVVSNKNHSLLLLQAYMGVVAMISLVLSAVVSQRKNDQEALGKARDELEARVIDRTAQLENRMAEQKRAQESLSHLSSRLLQLQDEERRRIARELHDSTGQELAFLSMNLHKLQRDIEKISPETAKEVAENYAVVQQIVSEVRTISHLLHPPLLDEIGLGFALQGYIDGFSERSNIKVHAEIPSELDRLGLELETAVFRVVQECLTNIHRHSGSLTASVRLDRSSTGINLEIKDEGKGIRSEKQRGVGLRGMTERVAQFGGNLEIISNETGTLVRAFFPVAVDGQPASPERSSGKASG